MADELEIKIRAVVDEAIANLKKTEGAVEGVTKKTKELDSAQKPLGDTMKRSAEGVTKIKNAVMEWASTLQIGVTIGNALVSVTNKIAAAMEKKAQALEKVIAEQQAYRIAMEAVHKGHIEEGETTEKTIANYVAFTAAMGKMDAASRKFIEAAGLKIPQTFKDISEAGKKMEVVIKGAFERGLNEGEKWVAANKGAIEEYISLMDAAQRETSKDFIAMTNAALQHIEVMKRVPAAVEGILPAFKGTITTMAEAELAVLELAKAEGVTVEQLREVIEKEYARTDAVGVTAAAYDTLIAAIDRLHERAKTIPTDIDIEIRKRRELQDEINKFTQESNQRGIEREKKQREEVNKTYESNVEKQKEWIRTQTELEDGMRKWTDATQGASSAFGALSGDFTAINAEVKSYLQQGGDLQKLQVGMTLLTIEMAQASERQNEQLRETLLLLRAVKEEQLEVFDVAQGWNDFVAVMVDGFKQGFTSLDQFIRGLTMFKTQLLQLYGQGGPGSKANEGLRDMLQSIQALINAAVGGQLQRGPNDPTPRGALERAFGGR